MFVGLLKKKQRYENITMPITIIGSKNKKTVFYHLLRLFWICFAIFSNQFYVVLINIYSVNKQMPKIPYTS